MKWRLPSEPLVGYAYRVNLAMGPELIGILSVGVALGALILAGFRRIDQRIDRLDSRIDKLEVRMNALEHRMAKLEGVLDGLREALFHRPPAAVINPAP